MSVLSHLSGFESIGTCVPPPENIPVKDSKVGTATVYPNPTNGLLTIKADESTVIALRVIDGFGRVLLHNNWSNDASSKRNLDLNQLPVGIYTLEITTADETVSTERIILQ